MDSSVLAVTENTVLPNRSCNPSLSHLRRCLPVGAARKDFTALVLDVSKAHRRIKIRPQDQGLLCFHHRGKLFQCLTLNFGARASSYYWSRAAGLLCRLLRRIVDVNQIYVSARLRCLRLFSCCSCSSSMCLLCRGRKPVCLAILSGLVGASTLPRSLSAWKRTNSNAYFSCCCPFWRPDMFPDITWSA